MVRVKCQNGDGGGSWVGEFRLGCRKWGCNKWGFKGCLAALPGNRPKSAFFALFLPFSPFSGGPEEHLENPENGGKRPFSSDILGFPQRAQRSKKFDLDRNFQSRSKFLISLENFNLDVSISPQKIGPRWVARSKISFSIEIFNLDRDLEFF